MAKNNRKDNEKDIDFGFDYDNNGSDDDSQPDDGSDEEMDENDIERDDDQKNSTNGVEGQTVLYPEVSLLSKIKNKLRKHELYVKLKKEKKEVSNRVQIYFSLHSFVIHFRLKKSRENKDKMRPKLWAKRFVII